MAVETEVTTSTTSTEPTSTEQDDMEAAAAAWRSAHADTPAEPATEETAQDDAAPPAPPDPPETKADTPPPRPPQDMRELARQARDARARRSAQEDRARKLEQREKDVAEREAAAADRIRALERDPMAALTSAGADPVKAYEALKDAAEQRRSSAPTEALETLRAEIAALKAEMRAAAEHREGESQDAQVQRAQRAYVAHVTENAAEYPLLALESADDQASAARALAVQFREAGRSVDFPEISRILERYLRDRYERQSQHLTRQSGSAQSSTPAPSRRPSPTISNRQATERVSAGTPATDEDRIASAVSYLGKATRD